MVQCLATRNSSQSCQPASGQGWNVYPSRSQLATSWQLHGAKEGNRTKRACAMERDLTNDFYNENYMDNPFGNLIDYRIYLSMCVLKIDSIF